METRFQRVELLIGEKKLARLKKARVMVFGIGGVGSFCVEALARSGIGTLILIDGDVISKTNINRQIHALTSTLGKSKVEVMAKRIQEINPECKVIVYHKMWKQEDKDLFLQPLDYVVDAIDTLTQKADLIEVCYQKKLRIISCLGMGNRLDSTKVKICRLQDTNYDPLAKKLRELLRKKGLPLTMEVVFSSEQPHSLLKRKTPPASMAFVPPTAGLMCASKVVMDLISEVKEDE